MYAIALQSISAASTMGGFDMRQVFAGTLIETRPDWAVTFVDNHDTQLGQSLESWIEGWFKLHAYSLILLRNEGTPVDLLGRSFTVIKKC